MDYIYIIIMILIIVVIILLGIVFKKLTTRREKYLLGIEKFNEKCKKYEATILEQKDIEIDGDMINAIILQFRDEESKKTVVHRYTLSHKKDYKRGDKVTLFYNENDDQASINDDNPFNQKAKECMILACVSLGFAILLMIVEALMIFGLIMALIIRNNL